MLLDFLKSRYIYSSCDAMCLLGCRRSLAKHLACDGIHLGKGNAIQLADIFDKTA